jgi:hypothetical protein
MPGIPASEGTSSMFRHRSRHRAQQAQRIARHAHQAAREQLEIAGLGVTRTRQLRRDVAALGSQVEQGAQDLCPR